MMRKTLALALAAVLALPIGVRADSYKRLWAEYEAAERGDLPRTQAEVLERVAAKAAQEGSWGNLLKAQTRLMAVMHSISPDSLAPRVAALEAQAERCRATDPALHAVICAVLGKAYADCPDLGDADGRISRDYYSMALSDPAMLASRKARDYGPFVIRGVDSKYFGRDLLSLIGHQAQAYGTMRDYYRTTSLRAAAMLSALWALEKEGRDPRPVSINKSRYISSLDSLVSVYGDLKACGEVAVERYRYMSTCPDVGVEERVSYISAAINRWGDWKTVNALRNELKDLTSPMVSAAVDSKVVFVGGDLVVALRERNLSSVTVTATRLSVDGDTDLQPDSEEDYRAMRRQGGLLASYSEARKYIGNPEHRVVEDTVSLGALPAGVYLLEVKTNKRRVKTPRTLVHVTDMFVLNQRLPEGRTRLAAVSAATGQPIPGALIDVETADGVRETVACDLGGECVYDSGAASIRSLRAHTPGDNAAPAAYSWNNFSHYANAAGRDILNLFTDRKVYRPGQTVHVAAILLNNSDGIETKAVEGRELTLSLKGANGKEVSRASVTTDAYGTAWADFELPQGGLTGTYSVSATGGASGSSRIRVERYVRPTFHVEFPEVNGKYQNGDTLVVTAHATTYSGVPVQGARVAYTVRRSQPLWWRLCAPSGQSPDEVLVSGEATTDGDGAFEIEMPMVLPGWDGQDGGPGWDVPQRSTRMYTITAEALVTDQAGETHSGELSLPLGSKPTAFACDLAETVLRDSLRTVTFTLKNMAGENVDAIVRYFVDGSFNAFEARTNTPAAVTWNGPSTLRSGRHSLTAFCEGDTIRQEFIVFGIDDARPCVDTREWFYLSGGTFPRDGGPVLMQVGSSDKDVHAFYTAISGTTVLASGTFSLADEVITRKLAYDERYGSGILVSVAWVKDGVMHSHNFSVQRPLPDKRLELSWATFRDRLEPGQSEQWRLTVSMPDGRPARAQLLATLYDASLDDLAPLAWAFTDDIRQGMPSSQWKASAYGRLSLTSPPYAKNLPSKRLKVDNLRFNELDLGCFSSMGRVPAVRTRVLRAARAGNAAEAVDAGAEAPAGTMAVADAEAREDGPDAAQPRASSQGTRENLDETAFFFPCLETDPSGGVTLDFTLPESVTTWNFLGIAHDADMNHGQISAEAVARKAVMVQPNVPRFVRAGDRATIAARIFNTSDGDVSGVAAMRVSDPETGSVLCERTRAFSARAGQTVSVSFDYEATEGASPLVLEVSVAGKGYSDGERHYLPVLPGTETVTTALPFTQHGPGETTLDLSGMFPRGCGQGRLTVEYADNPAWLMVQALPYVASPRDDNAISLAAAYYANRLGGHIAQGVPGLAEALRSWEMEGGGGSMASALERNGDLKAVALGDTPWVPAALAEAGRKAALEGFLDEDALEGTLSEWLSRLSRLQDDRDGSFRWWPGSRQGSPEVTVTILEMLTRLDAMTGECARTSYMMSKARKYLEARILEEAGKLPETPKGGTRPACPGWVMDYLYCNAVAGVATTAGVAEAAAALEGDGSGQDGAALHRKAMEAVVRARAVDMDAARALVRSLEEYSVSSAEMGRWYDSPRAAYSWCDYRIPTQVAAIEAMELVDPDGCAGAVEEMKRWLLQQKRTQAWDTPVNAVNAVWAFLHDGMSVLEGGERAVVTLDGKALDLGGATAGMGYSRVSVSTTGAGTLRVAKASGGTSWGAAYAQAAQPTSEVADASSGFTVRREVLAADGSPVGVAKVGDRVRVRVTVVADRDYDFVQVVDSRASCLEPVDQLSGWRSGCYRAIGDSDTCYFFDSMAKGEHVVESEFYVARAGSCGTGTCLVQCAYSPEYMARAASCVVRAE